MPSLCASNLHSRFLASLGQSLVASSDVSKRPLTLDLAHPLPNRVRLYLYTLTGPPGGRTIGEHKIQIIVPGQKKGERRNLDFSDGRFVLLAGFEPQQEVYAFWDARLYENIPHSRNVQIKAETIYTAFAQGCATQERRLWSGQTEVIVACDAKSLRDCLVRRFTLGVGL